MELRRALTTGEFVSGQRLTVRGLSDAMSTSVMPVRTAVVRLVAQGALEQLSNGSVMVPAFREEVFCDLMDVRIHLEGFAAESAAERITRAGLDQVVVQSQLLEVAWNSCDIDEYLRCNRAFKFAIYEHCGSAVLVDLIGALWLRVGPLLRSLESHRGRFSQVHFHDEIVGALRKGDGPGARFAMERDIRAGRDFIVSRGHSGNNGDPVGSEAVTMATGQHEIRRKSATSDA